MQWLTRAAVVAREEEPLIPETVHGLSSMAYHQWLIIKLAGIKPE